MKVCELLDLPKTKFSKGFKLGKKGRVVWTDVHADGDRKRIRVSRIETKGQDYPQAYIRYVKPSVDIELC